MKALTFCAFLLLASAPSFASSVCTLTIPAICASPVTVNCDGKELPAYSYKTCDDKEASKRTLTLKKLLDQDYKIASHIAYSGDGGELYTLSK
ncbi:MAG: hypothetical protein ACXVB9_02805 [Bdellovibrionota bacterium]